MWIACKDKMPPEVEDGDSIEVLVYAPLNGGYERYETAYFSGQHEVWFMDGGAQEVEYVTHWMPLPSPPNGNKE